jgi:hypothetical protein
LIRVRPTRGTDIGRLEAVERSATTLFRTLPDLAWIADDHVAGPDTHRTAVAQGLSWVAVDAADQPIGFLIAAVEDGADLHVMELSVAADHQGRGLHRRVHDAEGGNPRHDGQHGRKRRSGAGLESDHASPVARRKVVRKQRVLEIEHLRDIA